GLAAGSCSRDRPGRGLRACAGARPHGGRHHLRVAPAQAAAGAGLRRALGRRALRRHSRGRMHPGRDERTAAGPPGAGAGVRRGCHAAGAGAVAAVERAPRARAPAGGWAVRGRGTWTPSPPRTRVAVGGPGPRAVGNGAARGRALGHGGGLGVAGGGVPGPVRRGDHRGDGAVRRRGRRALHPRGGPRPRAGRNVACNDGFGERGHRGAVDGERGPPGV
ncbi:MAG: hypothetical protein AVDCRST_MAG89-1650, partial [uncultured Gemmatimonadetes bacterium]